MRGYKSYSKYLPYKSLCFLGVGHTKCRSLTREMHWFACVFVLSAGD